MRYSRVLFLAVTIGSSVSTGLGQQAVCPSADVAALPQGDPIAEALGLERYPLVDLRQDLGEVLIEKEAELVCRSIGAVREVIRLRATDQDNIGRGDHAKPIGCYDAEFTVSSADVVRADDQAGIAAPANLGKTFPAIVRFSNSEPKDVSDYRSATMGLAVKVTLDAAEHPKEQFLFERSGEQDFVAGGLDTFVSRNIVDYADLLELRIHPIRNALRIMDRHPEAYWVFGKEPLLRWLNPISSSAPMVLDKTFSSLVPYAWGDAAVKYRFEPCHEFDRSTVEFSRFDDSYQSKVVAEFLRSKDICYVLKIQVRPRPGSDDERSAIDRTFPIDDATARWPQPGEGTDTAGAAFHEVARVRIASGTPAKSDPVCEKEAFNPWSGLKAHQPLGSLSRARAAVYKASELVRKELYRTMPQQQ